MIRPKIIKMEILICVRNLNPSNTEGSTLVQLARLSLCSPTKPYKQQTVVSLK